MTGNNRIIGAALAFMLGLAALALPASAANTGSAAIGFSTGGIYYMPAGISGVEGTLNLDFGSHGIDTGTPVKIYSSLNKAGYVVNNESGGAAGYTVTLGLSSFSNGLEGATLTVKPDDKGLVSGNPSATDRPYFMGGQSQVVLEADGLSSAVVMRATDSTDRAHTALGRWGFNFTGDLMVYTNTIRAGKSSAVMTWEITIA